MYWRERFLKLLGHEEPDRIPLEVSRSPAFEAKLRNQLSPEELEKFSADLWIGIRGVGPGIPDEFARKGVAHEPFIHYGTGVWVSKNTMEDEWGIRRQLTAAGTESRVIGNPLRDANTDSLDEYSFPDPNAFGRFKTTKEDVKKLKEKGFWVVGSFGIDTFWCQAWYLRGFKQLMIDLYANPIFVEKLMGILLDYYVEIGKKLAELEVDLVAMADDIATQTGMIVSPKLWRKFIKPSYKKLISTLKPNVKYIAYHSDGNVASIIPDLSEVGVNVLNPIQPDCMNLSELKRLYGNKLTLWGGLSVQDVIPHGTVEDVNKHVIETIRTLAPGGGFVLGTSNLITQDTPVENFVAIYNIAKKYGKYPIR